MSKTNTWETALLEHLFQNADITEVGDAGGLLGSSTAGSLYISLHTDDPGEDGYQTTNEADYTSYARVAVARSDSAWTVSGNAVTNVSAVSFPQATGGSNTISHFGIGTANSGGGKLLYKGQLTAPLAVSNGITPSFSAGQINLQED